MIRRPLDMNELVRCLEKRYGSVELSPGEGLTKLCVAGMALTFPDAERLCLGETTPDRLKAEVKTAAH